MLGKLILLDIKFTYKKFVGMAGILLLIGLVMPWLNNSFISLGASTVLLIAIITIVVMCVVFVIQHFSRNLYGSEGYLMQTLPVKAYQHVLAKLVSVLWFNLMLIAGVVMVMLIMREHITWDMIQQMLTWSVIKRILWLLLNLNAAAILMITGIYFAVTLSQVAVRNKPLGGWGVVLGVALMIFFNWAADKIYNFAFTSFTSEIARDSMSVDIIGINVSGNTNIFYPLLLLAFSVLFFFGTSYLLKNKVNLK